MALDNDLMILSRVAMFGALGEDELRHLAFAAEPVRAEAGRILFRAGQPIDAAYILVSGKVECFTANDDISSSHEERGTIFGEAGLITRTEWKTTGRSATGSEFLRLARPVFRRVLNEYPRSALALQSYFGSQIKDVVRQLDGRYRKAGTNS